MLLWTVKKAKSKLITSCVMQVCTSTCNLFGIFVLAACGMCGTAGDNSYWSTFCKLEIIFVLQAFLVISQVMLDERSSVSGCCFSCSACAVSCFHLPFVCVCLDGMDFL